MAGRGARRRGDLLGRRPIPSGLDSDALNDEILDGPLGGPPASTHIGGDRGDFVDFMRFGFRHTTEDAGIRVPRRRDFADYRPE